MALASATAAALILGGCGGPSSATSVSPSTMQSQSPQESTGVANPFIDCESAADAASLAGFDVTFPESIPGYQDRVYQAIEGELAQAIYLTGDHSVLVRKAAGQEDVSGDYNDYPETSTIAVAGADVTLKGRDGKVFDAIWQRDGFSYAIMADQGLSREDAEEAVLSTR